MEAGETKHVEITTDFPPSLFCSNGSNRCSIHISVTVQSQDELMCGSMAIPQVVIGYDKNKKCGTQFTMENWNTELKIPVKATVDSLKDGDQKRTLLVESYIWTDMEYTNSQKYQSSVKVSLTWLLWLQQGTCLRFSYMMLFSVCPLPLCDTLSGFFWPFWKRDFGIKLGKNQLKKSHFEGNKEKKKIFCFTHVNIF